MERGRGKKTEIMRWWELTVGGGKKGLCPFGDRNAKRNMGGGLGGVW